jgi:hypothetical protein
MRVERPPPPPPPDPYPPSSPVSPRPLGGEITGGDVLITSPTAAAPADSSHGAPQVSQSSEHVVIAPIDPNHPSTHGANWKRREDRVVEDEGVILDEEYVEEIISQLWSIPKPERARTHDPHLGSGRLVWIRRDLIHERKVRLEDCFPVSRTQRIDHTLRVLSYSRDLCPRGDHPTFTEVLKRIPMSVGGRWVWRPDKPVRLAVQGRPCDIPPLSRDGQS